MNRAAIWLVLAYIAASAVTRFGSVADRIIPADFLALSIIFAAVFVGFRHNLPFPRSHLLFLPLLVVFTISAMLSRFPDRAVFELLVVTFAFVGSIGIIGLGSRWSDDQLRAFLRAYLLIMGALAVLFIVDFAILPGLVGRVTGGLSGTFKNTGQAGSFIGIHLAIMIALLLSGLVKPGALTTGSVVLMALALLFTVKRASWIGALLGLALLVVQMFFSTSVRDKKIGYMFVIFGALAAILGGLALTWALENVHGLAWRLSYKISEDTIDDFASGFFKENLDATIRAVEARPLFGVGQGNIAGIFTRSHEIHSTYLGILATAGLLGVVTYFVFVFGLLGTLYYGGKQKATNAWSAFLYYLLPLVIGLFASWGYTYHLRKREFWIMMAFIALADLARRRLEASRTET